ncbi:hypothetical protein P0L94_14730 [Microbacter sp. GSS18]|nr:hypothetical protein P0L94_14730 [Microbacter sp. GSS18]
MRTRYPRRRRWPIGASAVLAAAALAGLAGCSEDGGAGDRGLPTLTHDVVQSVLAASGADVVDLSGTLVVEPNGCLTWRTIDAETRTANGAWIIWPEAVKLDADVVLLPSGRHAGQGSRLDVTGAYLTLRQLPGGQDATSFLGEYGRVCGADDRGVLLIVDAEA